MTPFVSLYTRRELLWQFLVRNVKARHRGSILGAFWLLANPLLMLGLYVFAFGVIFGGRFTDSPDESTIDYALGVFLGLNVLGLISGIIGSSPGIIVSQPNFVKKVVFPLEILPAATMGALAYDLLISFSLCLIGVLLVGPGSDTLLPVRTDYHFPSLYDRTWSSLVFFRTGCIYKGCQPDRVLFWDCITLCKWGLLFGCQGRIHRPNDLDIFAVESIATHY
jgi:hypothetical protein